MTVPSLLLATFFAITSAHGQSFSIDALLDDTGIPADTQPQPSALLPTRTTIDQVDKTVTIDWPKQATESLPFGAIVQIEHARAWDGAPEELFIAFRDGRRILLSQGKSVPKQTELIRAWLAERVVELPVGEGHSKHTPERSSPSLRLTTAGVPLSIGKIKGPVQRQTSAPASDTVDAKRQGTCVNCIDKQDVDRAVKMRMDKIRGCYQRSLQRDPSLAGEIVVRFEVQRDGTIGSASIKRSSIRNSGVESCVREQFLQMTFPPLTGNQTVQVTYPIVFSSGQ